MTLMSNIMVNVNSLKYKDAAGTFGRKLAILGRSKNELFNFIMFEINTFVLFLIFTFLFTECLVGWWSNYGGETPKLQKMAMRILSLTTTSSSCQRNWSTSEGVN